MSAEQQGSRYTPTTTHGPWGSGHPHLIVTREEDRLHFPLDRELVRIGSAQGLELQLPDLAALHAEVRHTDYDEYALIVHGKAYMSHRPEPVASLGGTEAEILRSGARFVLGPWAFVFERDEFADHGRPYGGRQGGEGARQRRQPPRPDYRAHGGLARPETESPETP